MFFTFFSSNTLFMLREIWNRLKSVKKRKDIVLLVEDIERVTIRLLGSLEIESNWKNAALSIPRITVGCLLLSDEWRLKMGMPVNELQEILSADFTNQTWFGWDSTVLLSWFDSLGALILGGMMITGFNTRLSALSILWIISEQTFQSMITPSVSIIWMSLLTLVAGYLLILGSGKYGFDYLIRKKFKKS